MAKEQHDVVEELLAAPSEGTIEANIIRGMRPAADGAEGAAPERDDARKESLEDTFFMGEDVARSMLSISPRPNANFKHLSRSAFDAKKKAEALRNLFGKEFFTGGAGPCDREWMLVTEQLVDLNHNVKNLAAALRAQQADQEMPLSEMAQAFHEAAIDYTDRRPSVEVTVEICDVDNFDLVTQEFEAEFKVFLDWEETDFVEGVHYHQDIRSGGFTLAQWLVEDRRNTFNPMIEIDNAVEMKVEEGNDGAPSIHRLVARPDGDTVWLTKSYHFSGTLKCRHVDAKMFPWDMQRLPVVIRSTPMEGLTTLGTERYIRLVDPYLRRMEEVERLERFEKGKRMVDRMSLLRADDLRSKLSPHIEAHHWSRFYTSSELEEDDDQLAVPNFGIGELLVCAFGGSDVADDLYMVEVIVVRDWTAYFWDFLIQILLVVLSLSSAWVPFNDDSVANKLSISLAIVLAIVFFCCEKPSAIADLTYPTMHDYFEQIMVLVAIANSIVPGVVTWVQCWGFPREVRDEVLGVGNLFPPEWCEESFLGSSHFDCAWTIVVCIFTVATFIGCVCTANVYRLNFLKRVMDEINSSEIESPATLTDSSVAGFVSSSSGREVSIHDAVTKSVSTQLAQARLMFTTGKQDNTKVIRGTNNTQWMAGEDGKAMAQCLARQRMPMLRLFPSCWVHCSLFGCPCCKCCCCCSRRRRAWQHDDGEDGERRHLLEADSIGDKKGKTAHATENPISDYHGLRPLLKRTEAANVIDCGTGEVGFYQYRWRPPTGSFTGDQKDMLFLDVENKLKLPQDKTFMEEFVQNPHGAITFAEELMNRFEILHGHLRRTPTSQSLLTTGSGQNHQARRKTNLKFLFGPTGQNRETMIRNLHGAAEAVLDWAKRVQAQLNRRLAEEETGLTADFLLFIPSEQDEATYELVATEWLVQAGNLNVNPQDIPSGRNKVPFAGPELSQALKRASKSRPGNVSIKELVWEFEDLLDHDLDQLVFENKFKGVADPAFNVEMEKVSEIIRNDAQLMRALIKSRLFNGTLSAGGGSCQITVKPEHEERKKARAKVAPSKPTLVKSASSNQILRTSEFHSVKLGNKTPLTAPDGGEPMWSRNAPMSPALIDAWRTRIKNTIEEMDLPPKIKEGQLRGVYIGISAVFYAAKEAGCTERLLPRDAFLHELSAKLKQHLANPPPPQEKNGKMIYDHRPFSNLVLVYEIISRVLAPSAWIVCKRNWVAQPSSLTPKRTPRGADADGDGGEEGGFCLDKPPQYVATWSLGFFLNQAVDM